MDIKKLIEDTVMTDWKDILIKCVEPFEYEINQKLSNQYACYVSVFPEKN